MKRAWPAPTPRAALGELATGAVYVVGLGVALSVVASLLSQSPLALAVAGAIVAEVVASRAGVQWLEANTQLEFGKLVSTAARAALPFVVAAALLLALGAAFGLVVVAPGHVSLAVLFAVGRAIAVAVRDELAYRGIAFTVARRAGIPSWAALVFGALASGAVVALAEGASLEGTLLEIVAGAGFGLAWSKGPVAAVAAHAVWSFVVGAGLHGQLLDVTWKTGTLALDGRATGAPAWLAIAIVALGCATSIAVEALGRRKRRSP